MWIYKRPRTAKQWWLKKKKLKDSCYLISVFNVKDKYSKQFGIILGICRSQHFYYNVFPTHLDFIFSTLYILSTGHCVLPPFLPMLSSYSYTSRSPPSYKQTELLGPLILLLPGLAKCKPQINPSIHHHYFFLQVVEWSLEKSLNCMDSSVPVHCLQLQLEIVKMFWVCSMFVCT